MKQINKRKCVKNFPQRILLVFVKLQPSVNLRLIKILYLKTVFNHTEYVKLMSFSKNLR